MNKFAVIRKAKGYSLGEVIKTFKERSEANYFITDVYGPESNQYEVVALLTPMQEIDVENVDIKIVNIGDFIHEA